MPLQHPEIDALARDLADLAAKGSAREIGEAREAIQRAADSLSRYTRPASPDPSAERAVTLARMAVDRARRAVGAGRPKGRFPEVEVDSEIPDSHPAKSAIEAAVAGAFVGVKGRWRVAIIVPPTARWWGIRVEGETICWTGTLEGPDEQAPEFLAGRVREAVQLGLMQAALPRRRRPRA